MKSFIRKWHGRICTREGDCGQKVVEELNGHKSTAGAQVRDNPNSVGRCFVPDELHDKEMESRTLRDVADRCFSIPGRGVTEKAMSDLGVWLKGAGDAMEA